MGSAEGASSSAPRKACRTCGREMVDHDKADGRDDPRINCGGDCAMCMYGLEEGAPSEIRGVKPRGYDEYVAHQREWSLDHEVRTARNQCRSALDWCEHLTQHNGYDLHDVEGYLIVALVCLDSLAQAEPLAGGASKPKLVCPSPGAERGTG